MFKNKQKHFLISVLLMILFLAASGTAFSADLNETSEVPEVRVCKDNLENSQNDVVGSSEITLNGGKFSDIQKAIDNVGDGGTIHLNGYYSAQNNDSVIYVNKNIRIAGGLDTVLDGKNISCIFSIQKTGSNCQISNLKFVNGMDVHGGAMIILGKNVVVENSTKERINKVSAKRAKAQAKASNILYKDILANLNKSTEGLLKTSFGVKKSDIYKEEIFQELSDKEKKVARKKFRNTIRSLSESLTQEKDKTRLEKLKKAFLDFYKQVYKVNDFSLSSVCSENMKETNKEILKKALQIVKK